MDDAGEAFGWASRQPGWLWKCVLMGLLSLVPVLGWIAATGWMLATLDNLRSDRQELPAAGLYLARCWRLSLVLLVYALLVGVVADFFALPGFMIASALHDTPGALIGIFLVIAGCALAALALVAVSTLLLPVIVVRTDSGGLRAALALPAIAGAVRARPQAAIVAALLLVVDYALQSAGSLFCGIGLVLSVGYSLPVMAAVLDRYERAVERPLFRA